MSMYSTWFLVYSIYIHEPLLLVFVNIISIQYINRTPLQLSLSPCSYSIFLRKHTDIFTFNVITEEFGRTK